VNECKPLPTRGSMSSGTSRSVSASSGAPPSVGDSGSDEGGALLLLPASESCRKNDGNRKSSMLSVGISSAQGLYNDWTLFTSPQVASLRYRAHWGPLVYIHELAVSGTPHQRQAPASIAAISTSIAAISRFTSLAVAAAAAAGAAAAAAASIEFTAVGCRPVSEETVEWEESAAGDRAAASTSTPPRASTFTTFSPAPAMLAPAPAPATRVAPVPSTAAVSPSPSSPPTTLVVEGAVDVVAVVILRSIWLG